MVHIRNRRSQEAVRWYVLTLPTAVGGRDNIYSSKGLDAELSRRKRCGEPLFEYFAPSYVEARKVGIFQTCRQPHLLQCRASLESLCPDHPHPSGQCDLF